MCGGDIPSHWPLAGWETIPAGGRGIPAGEGVLASERQVIVDPAHKHRGLHGHHPQLGNVFTHQSNSLRVAPLVRCGDGSVELDKSIEEPHVRYPQKFIDSGE